MQFTEATEIYLMNTPLSIDNEHILVFDTQDEKLNYIMGLEHVTYSGNTFQKDNNKIKIAENIENIRKYNYVVYRNLAWNNSRWFYCFIENMEYINNNLTMITIKTDSVMTWWHELTFNMSFIEREHWTTDYYNNAPDIPKPGKLVESKAFEQYFKGGYFVFCSTDITQDDVSSADTYSFKIGSYSVPCLVLYWKESQSDDFAMTMQNIAKKGWGDRILSAVYIPWLGDESGLDIVDVNVTELGGYVHFCNGFKTLDSIKMELSFDFSLDVANLKMLTYPYAKILVQDITTGQSIELMPDGFDGTTASFEVRINVCETPSYKIIPKNYWQQELAYNEALVIRCNTSLPVANNSYAKYMMMNGEINQLRMASAAIGGASAVASGSPMGILTGAEQIMNVLAQENQAAKVPNQVTAFTDGALERICFYSGIKISLFTMTSYYEEVCQNFWHMYGYPVNKLRTPNMTTNSDYRYVKMINPNIEGGQVPAEDMREIENVFSKGVTMWFSPSLYKHY
jgi:hypothetical protein